MPKQYFVPGIGFVDDKGEGKEYFAPGAGIVNEKLDAVSPDEMVSITVCDEAGLIYSIDEMVSLTVCDEAVVPYPVDALVSVTACDVVIQAGLKGITTVKTAMPVSRADLPAVVYDDKIYIFGGYGASDTDYRAEVRRYDPATDTWDDGSLTNMTYARWGSGAAVHNGIVYVFGGQGSSGNNKVEAYNIVGNSWATKNNLPAYLATDTGMGAITVGDYIYLFLHEYCYKYNPSNDTYTRLTDAPFDTRWATYAHVNVSGEDRIYVIGGFGGGTSCNYYYRPDYNDWSSQQASVPYNTYGQTRDNPVINGLIYCACGHAGSHTFFAEVYAYDPAANSWSGPLFPFAHARDGVACGVVDGKLYVIGGRNTYTPYGLNYNEEFDPSIAATILGKNTVGGDGHSIQGYLEAFGRIQATENGVLDNIYVFIGVNVGNNVRVCIYNDDSNYPGSVLWESGSIAVPGDQQWLKVPVTSVISIVSGNYYWMALQADANTSFVYDPGVTKYKGQSYGPFANPFIGGASSASWDYSMFAELTNIFYVNEMVSETTSDEAVFIDYTPDEMDSVTVCDETTFIDYTPYEMISIAICDIVTQSGAGVYLMFLVF